MAEVAEFYSLNLLHVHYAIPHSVSALLARQMLATRGIHLPFITTLHGTDITLVGLDRSYLPITKFGIEESDGVTSISSYLRDRTRDAFAITSEIEVIRNFVNCDVYFRDPELVASMRPRFAEPNERLLVHLSNFRPVKRIQDVVKVFARVAKAMPARLMLIGDGPDRSVAEYLAREHDVQDRVHFIGKQDNVNELLPLADLMLMPSEMESFGLGALEAMACGVPPITTRVGGLPELVTDGVDGFLEPVGDIAAQSRRAIELLTNEPLHRKMAEAARRTAVERFASSTIIPQYEKYYEEILANGR
jgi:N-acetyl-alpha-D-glucosaminyl L-malate synthase BshA